VLVKNRFLRGVERIGFRSRKMGSHKCNSIDYKREILRKKKRRKSFPEVKRQSSSVSPDLIQKRNKQKEKE
jgi:HJR/Mrr/RecB family endonuclease